MAIVYRPQKTQEIFLSCPADIAIYGGAAGGGKCLRLDTHIPTPNGFKVLGDIEDGDVVLDESELPCNVIKAHDHLIPDRCYRLSFDDGGTIDACSEHLWTFEVAGEDREPVSVTLNTERFVEASSRYGARIAKRGSFVALKSAEIIDPVPMRCLTVDSPSRLYLVGRTAIPTHNTFALLFEMARHYRNPNWGGVIFRHEAKQILNEGGLRDSAMELYPGLGAEYRSQPMPTFTFPSGARVSFSHINLDTEVAGWQGSQIPTIGFDELTHFCLTPDHEVLSKDGWKPITDVSKGEMVASLDVFGELCFLPAAEVHRFDYSGEMINICDARGISTIATPNHNILVTTNHKSDRWSFITAEHLSEKSGYSVFRVGGKTDAKGSDFIAFDDMAGRGFGTNQNSASVVSVIDYAEFLGWYMSEGSAFEVCGSPCISIRQMKTVQSLDALMKRLPWRSTKDEFGGYRIFSRQLYNELKPLGNLYVKRVPRFLFSESASTIEAFLDAFCLGDGHEMKKEGVAYGGLSYGLANEGLVDDLQELYTLVGRVSVKSDPVTVARDGKEYIHWRLSVSKKSRKLTQIRNTNIKRVKYDGDVWCLSVPGTHNFLVRHRGRCHFTGNSAFVFFYMMSRNRSTCGVKPYIRATCNPDPDSWVADFIAWWIDQETGYPIKERGGKIRHFVRRPTGSGMEIVWGDTNDDVAKAMGFDRPKDREIEFANEQLDAALLRGEDIPDDIASGPVQYVKAVRQTRSMSFIPSSVYDNAALLSKDPGYLANLKSLDRVEQARLLGGNWKVRAAAGLYFPVQHVQIVQRLSQNVMQWLRMWDLAATEPNEAHDPDWTVGLKIGRTWTGTVVVGDVIRVRKNARFVRDLVKATAMADGRSCWIGLIQDPGQAGKGQFESYRDMLRGYSVFSCCSNKKKELTAEPVAAEWQGNNVVLVLGDWNSALIDELEKFPTKGVHDDQVDALSNGYSLLPPVGQPNYAEAGGLRRRGRER